MDETPQVRVGIVGLGTIGRIHANRIERLEEGELVAGADVSPDARDAFAEEFGVQTYADHHALLDGTVDAVVVGVPNKFHEGIAVDALEAGVDVLLEKPLAHSLASAERIAAAARDADGHCMVGFTMRFSSLTERAIGLRDEGRFGSLSHVEVEYLRRNGVPGGGNGWFTDPELAGGGVVMDLGVHVIDLALYALDYPTVREVSAVTRTEFGDYAVEDSATALLRCVDGRTVAVDTSWHGTTAPSRRCVIRGTDGGATFDVTDSDLEFVPAAPDAESEVLPVESNDMHLAEDRAFLRTVAGEREGGRSLEEGLEVQRIIEAIYDSGERERAVSVSEYR